MKAVIKSFNDFDEVTKWVYRRIREEIQKSSKTPVNVWAAGSRVFGTWRTEQEELTRAFAANRRPKFSDYDFQTDAKNPPNNQLLSEKVGVKVDRLGGTCGILIEP